MSYQRYTNKLYYLCVVFFLCFSAVPTFAALLTGVNVVSQSPEKSVVSIQLSDMPISSFSTVDATEQSNGRCYIDLYSTVRSDLVSSIIRPHDANITSVRMGHRGHIVRVTLELKGDVQCIKTVDQVHRRILLVAGHDVESVVAAQSKTAPAPAAELPQQPVISEETKVVTADKGDMGQTPTKQSAATVVQPSVDTMVKGSSEHIVQHDLQVVSQSEQPVTQNEQQGNFTDMFAQNLEDENPFKFWGWIKGYGAADLVKDDAEDTSFDRTRGRLGMNWEHSLSDGNTLQTALSGDIDRIYYANDEADEKTSASLYEAYASLTNPSWDVTFGKQRIRWGKGDQVSPLDMLNAEDLRQPLGVSLDEMKIPAWLMRVRYFFSEFTVDAVVEPWIQTSKLDYFDSDWALYRNLRQTILSNPYVSDELKEYVRNLRISEDEPDASPENASAALRLSWQTDSSDFAVSSRYGWETIPTITSFPVTNFSYSGQTGLQLLQSLSSATFSSDTVESTYKRQKTIGFEWETILLDQIGFRGEVAYIDRVSFLNQQLLSSRKKVSYLVAGVDYTSENDWYFNLQTAWERLYNYESNILYYDQDNIALLGEIRKSIWRGRIEFLLKFSDMLTDGSSYLQPAVRLKYFTDLEIEAGLMLFNGDIDSILGSYDDADQVYLQTKYSF